jgi:hypothetical protein
MGNDEVHEASYAFDSPTSSECGSRDLINTIVQYSRRDRYGRMAQRFRISGAEDENFIGATCGVRQGDTDH